MKYTIISFYTLMNDDHHEGIKDVPPEDLELPLWYLNQMHCYSSGFIKQRKKKLDESNWTFALIPENETLNSISYTNTLLKY